jgi:hypothetical protein
MRPSPILRTSRASSMLQIQQWGGGGPTAGGEEDEEHDRLRDGCVQVGGVPQVCVVPRDIDPLSYS